MGIVKSTRSYEKWLGRQTPLIAADLEHKHQQMREGSFAFLRATFYRWIENWAVVCPKLDEAPKVLAVGDLHVDNFGTWRDAGGRLVWGINDFDETFPLAYTADLVRLATSAILAIKSEHLSIAPERACRAILTGYRESLAAGGQPIVVDREHRWLAPLVGETARDPEKFWQKIADLPDLSKPPPKAGIDALRQLLPDRKLALRYAHRVAGIGSLGKERYVAHGEWNGGPIARECKPLTRSAVAWATGNDGAKTYYGKILKTAIRSVAPLFIVHGDWIVRRIAPECSRVDLGALSRVRDDQHLLRAMGWETANVHLGTRDARENIEADLKSREKNWLLTAARAMLKSTLTDWERWKEKTAAPAVDKREDAGK